MASFKERLTPELIDFIRAQPMFFTASAAEGTRVNVSPKGMDTFRVLDDLTVGYLDVTGSGNETAAHLQHGGRMTIMFCSFGTKPLILRLYGRGELVRSGSPRWDELHETFPTMPGERQIVVLHVESLQTSCGWGVPKMELSSQRQLLLKWADEKGPDGLADYLVKKNSRSIDGLPIDLTSSTETAPS